MARKPKVEKIEFDIQFSCIIRVDSARKETFSSDLAGGKLACSAKLIVGDSELGFTIYPDQISGGINFRKLNELSYEVSATGKFTTVDTFGHLPEIRQLEHAPYLILTYVIDNDVNSYHINGKEDDECPMGKIVL